MTAGGLRSGEVRAGNVNNIVADDVYRVAEEVHSITHQLAKPQQWRASSARNFFRPPARKSSGGSRRNTARRRMGFC